MSCSEACLPATTSRRLFHLQRVDASRRTRRGAIVLGLAVLLYPHASRPSDRPTCDLTLIRVRAEQTFPEYGVAVRSEHGVITIVLTPHKTTGTFAVSLHASGTRLMTSAASVQLDRDELQRASRPLTAWSQQAELQQQLAACSHAGLTTDLADVLHRAARAALPTNDDDSGIRFPIAVGDVLVGLLIGGVVVGLWRVRKWILVAEALGPALLVLVALALRFVAHPGPSDIRVVLEDTGTRRAGWAAMLHFVFGILPWRDETIWNLNRVVGALSAAALYVVMRRRFSDRIVALAAAAALAATPLIVRFSASDTPYILLCVALLGALIAYDRFAESSSVGAMCLIFGLLTAALQLRPEAPWLIVPAALLALAGGLPRGGMRAFRRPAVVLGALLFTVANGIGLMFTLQGNVHQARDFVLLGSLLGSPWVNFNMTPPPLLALLACGAAAAVLYRYRWPGLLWLVATTIALPLNTPATVTSQVPSVEGYLVDTRMDQYANARHHIPAMYLACGLVGLGIATVLDVFSRWMRRRVPAAGAIGVAIVCVATVPRIDVLQRMWTPQREFEFFRSGLSRIGSDCRVVAMLTVSDAGFVPFDYLSPIPMLDLEAFVTNPSASDCVVYYRGGNCYAVDLVAEAHRQTFSINPVCRTMEQRFQLELIIEEHIAAIPYRGEIYARNPLPVGFYRVRGLQGGT